MIRTQSSLNDSIRNRNTTFYSLSKSRDVSVSPEENQMIMDYLDKFE